MSEGTVLCPEGHENPSQARYCVVCGATVGVADTPLPEQVVLVPESSDVRGRKRAKAIKILGAAAGAIVIVMAGLYFLLTAPVPDVTATIPAAAATAITAAGFNPGETTKDFSESVPRGTVMSQSPQAGSRNRKGGTVSIVVSWGPVVVTPNVSGLSLTVAQANLKELSLTDDSESIISETVPEGQVMSQEPASGERVEQGTTVHLVLSAGPPTTTLTVIVDGSSYVADLDFGDCSLFTTIWNSSYRNSVIVNRAGETLSALSGGWMEKPGNGTYFPCYIVATFPDTPTGESEYRVNMSAVDPESNNLGWVSRAELEASNWTYMN